jgi:hypothetical protein
MRKTKHATIDAEGRDNGKLFLITEMPASQAERWAFRAFQALARAGVDMPENVSGAGMAGIAVVGLKALGTIPFYEATELMDEMFSCVRIVRDKAHPETAMPLMEEDIEEVSTRLHLRSEVFELHTGFSFAGVRQSLTPTPAIDQPT